MKAYTSIKQSKKLAEILPIESADMWYGNEDHYKIAVGKWKDNEHDEDDVPCWSLSALLSVISIEHNLHGYLTENGMVYRVETLYAGNSKNYDNPVDACVDLILKLHEQKIL